MDKVGFLAANAAASAMSRQENVANNLANISTSGFRAQVMALQTTPLVALNARGEALLDTRTFAAETVTGFDSRPGVMQQTGRDLDMAVKTTGWFAVQRPGGGEGYTRNGSFNLNAAGVLVTNEGLPVLGEGGLIELPQNSKIQVSETGLVSALSTDPLNPGFQQVAQLRLVNPDPFTLERGLDGYFQLKDGGAAAQDPNVRVASGFLEGSNVNPAESVVEMIAAQRMFDMSMKAVTLTKESDQKADSVLQVN